MARKLPSNGFSIVEVIIVLVIVATVGLGGFFVWHKTRSDDALNKPNTKMTQNEGTNNQPTDPYSGWKSYSNASYGISFRYPVDWTVDEGAVSVLSSATKQEYAINLKRNEDTKYNDMVSIEVLGLSLDAVAAWYDDYFGQSSSNNVAKTTNSLKGKQSIQYLVSSGGVETRLYLLGSGNKTYTFSSINEGLNAQTDAQYWTKFTKILDSLEVN